MPADLHSGDLPAIEELTPIDSIAAMSQAHQAQGAAALYHPNICTIRDIGETDGLALLVMAYVEGESLSEKVKKP